MAVNSPYSVGSRTCAVRSTSFSVRRRYSTRSATVIIFSPWRSQYGIRSLTRAIVPSSFMTSQTTPAGVRPARRARSTAASVWPVRSRTPPGFARSGNTWPGCTRSLVLRVRMDRDLDRARAVVRGDAGRHSLARLDRNGERGAERRFVVFGHRMEAELVAALAREAEADEPARVRRHEVDRVGRRELRGDDEVALVLAIGSSTTTTKRPERISSIASSIGRERRLRLGRSHAEDGIRPTSSRSRRTWPSTSTSRFSSVADARSCRASSRRACTGSTRRRTRRRRVRRR